MTTRTTSYSLPKTEYTEMKLENRRRNATGCGKISKAVNMKKLKGGPPTTKELS
ncbi:hypothetical protein X975_06319, partial [Stegodyphus mimosarum]